LAWPKIELALRLNRLSAPAAGTAGRVTSWCVLALVSVTVLLSAACGGETAGETAQSGRVTVPDDVSGLPSGEVERRLSGLLEPGQPVDGGLAAPGVEPTAVPTPAISIEDILDALNSGHGGVGEIVISVSPSMSQGLANPVLRIKTPPANGSAIVLPDGQLLFVPNPGFTGSDSFEYELLDGAVPVFSAVIEVRPPAGSANGTSEAAQ
jgi:hypothetical protein